MFPENEIITGERFQELAEASIATPEKLLFHASLSEQARARVKVIHRLPGGQVYLSPADLDSLRRSRTIFVYGDLLDVFFVAIAPHLDQPFVLLSHNADTVVGARFEPVLENPHLLRWYAQNVDPDWTHPKIVSVPIGIANRQWRHGDLTGISAESAYRDKSIWLYANINTTTAPTHRNGAVAALSGNPAALVEGRLPFDRYIERIARSRFVASPRGNGPDCHRTWEALYLGAVPVMPGRDKVACLDGLPVMETGDWTDLTPDRLRSCWDAVTGSTWRFDALYLSHWRDRIEEEFRTPATPAAPSPRLTPVVLVHLGPEAPRHAAVALRQARSFASGDVLMVVEAAAREPLARDAPDGVRLVTVEDLGIGPTHARFKEITRPVLAEGRAFSVYTTERFFVIETLMRKMLRGPAVHIESDNLIYFDPSDYERIFRSCCGGIGATFDSDLRCIPGFVYFRDAEAVSKLNAFILERMQAAAVGTANDMLMLAEYRRLHPDAISALPVIPPDYPRPLRSLTGLEPADPGLYSSAFDAFRSLFDAAALGQYLGGVHSRGAARDTRGFVNESAVYDPRAFGFEVRTDHRDRKCYYVRSASGLWRVNNLHIHSKNLAEFSSV